MGEPPTEVLYSILTLVIVPLEVHWICLVVSPTFQTAPAAGEVIEVKLPKILKGLVEIAVTLLLPESLTRTLTRAPILSGIAQEAVPWTPLAELATVVAGNTPNTLAP